MKYLFILPIIFLLTSCSKQNVNSVQVHTDTTSNAYIIVNDTMHVCNLMFGGAINNNADMYGYEIVLDSTGKNSYPNYYALDIQCSDTSLNNKAWLSVSFENWFVEPSASIQQQSESFTITNNSNSKISGYFSGTFIFDVYTTPSNHTITNENVSGVFNNIKIKP